MRTIITGDLHLSPRQEDQYRWAVFDFIRHQNFDALIILGDLTEEKDCHSGQFVNRVVEELLAFVADGKEVHILMGNHDYTRSDCPFFGFFKHYADCFYHSTPQIWELGNLRWAFYPHNRNPEKYWPDMQRGTELGVKYTLCHQVFTGAQSESGASLTGCDARNVVGAGKVFAGDVHVPQTVDGIEYVGAPYPIRFGDSYKPRMVMIDGLDCSQTYLYPESIQKIIVEIKSPDEIEYNQEWRVGDQLKVILCMRRSEFGMWEKHRKRIQNLCTRNDLTLCGLELRELKRERLNTRSSQKVMAALPADQFRSYCKQAGVDKEDVEVGSLLLEM